MEADLELSRLLRLMRQHPHSTDVFAAIDHLLISNSWDTKIPLDDLFQQSSAGSSTLAGAAKTVADRLLLHSQTSLVEWLIGKRYLISHVVSKSVHFLPK